MLLSHSQKCSLAPTEILKLQVMYDPFNDFYCVSPNGMCLKDFQQKMPRGRHNQALHHKNHTYLFLQNNLLLKQPPESKVSNLYNCTQIQQHPDCFMSSGILFEPWLNSHCNKVRSEEKINKSSVSLVPLHFPRTLLLFSASSKASRNLVLQYCPVGLILQANLGAKGSCQFTDHWWNLQNVLLKIVCICMILLLLIMFQFL